MPGRALARVTSFATAALRARRWPRRVGLTPAADALAARVTLLNGREAAVVRVRVIEQTPSAALGATETVLRMSGPGASHYREARKKDQSSGHRFAPCPTPSITPSRGFGTPLNGLKMGIGQRRESAISADLKFVKKSF